MVVSAQVRRLNLLRVTVTWLTLAHSGLDNCGFQVNQDKSDWEPKSIFSWIGYVIVPHFGFILLVILEWRNFSLDLNEVCANLEVSAFILV